jgi:acyl-CoA thioester hydrolase
VQEPGIRSSVQLRVRYAETDQMGVVYHANYLVWCEIGRTELIRTLGTTYASLEKDGIMLAVSDASLRFHASARYDDPIVVETTLHEVRSRSITFDYRIARQEGDEHHRLVSARTTLVALDPQGRPRSLPPSLLQLFRGTPPSTDA